MIDNQFFAVIPARKGSKGIINKNMQLIGEKPMILYTMEAALNSNKLKNTILSSDDQNIINLAHKIGLDAPFTRPDYLAEDNSKISDVILHALGWYELTYSNLPKNIVLLQPTSPFRDSEDIDRAIKLFENSTKKTLVSATEISQHPGDFLIKNKDGDYRKLEIDLISNNLSGRQSFPDAIFVDGGIYISDTELFLSTHELLGDNPEIMMISQSHAVDIDTDFDLKIARAIYNSSEF